MADITPEDLRAAVAAGHLSEAQAASLGTLAEVRAGVREAEDEPFELFRGFSEIFVSVGLGILITGGAGMALAISPTIISILGIVILWALARYFTLKRRMMLPSIVLVTAFAGAVSLLLAAQLTGLDFMEQMMGYGLGLEHPPVWRPLAVCAGTALALAIWFRQFRVPFTLFLVGLCGLGAVLSVAAFTGGLAAQNPFDLLEGSSVAWGTLILGLLALAGGIWFDMKDPHRLGRMSASGFWLHLVAAPALVNTVAQTFVSMGPGLGYALMALALAVITLLAIVIDRRSFLTAGIGYLIFLLVWATDSSGDGSSWFPVLLFIGVLLTMLGTWWIHIRCAVMRGLPDFPGKRRLPPYDPVVHATAT